MHYPKKPGQAFSEYSGRDSTILDYATVNIKLFPLSYNTFLKKLWRGLPCVSLNLGVCIYDYVYIRFIRPHSNISSKKIKKQTNTTPKPPQNIIINIITHTPAKPSTSLESLSWGRIHG
jgi:hypothetical protein